MWGKGGGEGNCAAIERQKLSRNNFCLAASRCLSGPSGQRLSVDSLSWEGLTLPGWWMAKRDPKVGNLTLKEEYEPSKRSKRTSGL